MELAWCKNCQKVVSLARAVAELPCPGCGMKEYQITSDCGRRDELLFTAERMMRIGRWAEASAAVTQAFEDALISAADKNLTMADLEWRKQCAASAAEMLADGQMPLDVFRERLVSQYDGFVVDWLLREYHGIRLIPSGCTYAVEVA